MEFFSYKRKYEEKRAKRDQEQGNKEFRGPSGKTFTEMTDSEIDAFWDIWKQRLGEEAIFCRQGPGSGPEPYIRNWPNGRTSTSRLPAYLRLTRADGRG